MFFGLNIFDILILVVVAIVFILALIRVVKNTKNGCSCGCDNCTKKCSTKGKQIMIALTFVGMCFGMGNISYAKDVTYYGDKAFITEIVNETANENANENAKGTSSETIKNAHKYYISPNGNDKNNGDKNHPFATFEYAISKLAAGDILYVMDGTYKQNIYLGDDVKGSKGKYITIKALHKNKAVITSSDNSSKDYKTPLVEIDGASYVKVKGLKLTGLKGDGSYGMLVNSGSNHIIISGNEIKNIKKGTGEYACANGIILYGSSAKKRISNVLICNNYIHDCDTGWAEALTVTANCRYINIIGNRVKNITNIGIDISGNYGYCKVKSKDFPMYCLMYKNIVNNCVSPYATSYGLYVDGGQNIDIIENTVTKCSGGIEVGAEKRPSSTSYSTKNIVVKGNSLTGNIECGIAVGGYKKNLGWVINIKITRNKCVNNGLKGGAIITLSKCKNVTIKGNVLKNKKSNSEIIYYALSKSYIKNVKISLD